MSVTLDFGKNIKERTFTIKKNKFDIPFSFVGIAPAGIAFSGALNLCPNSGNYMLRNKVFPNYVGAGYIGARSRRFVTFSVQDIKVDKTPITFKILHKEGGLTKLWHYNSDYEVCFKQIKMELNAYGCGAASIEFAYLDIPIEHDDIFEFWYDEKCIYKGFIENDIDFSNPKADVSPFTKRLKEILFTGTYTAGTNPLIVLQDVIDSAENDSGIKWNAEKINLGSPNTLELKEYKSETSSSIIDDVVATCENRYWGVDTSNELYIAVQNTSVVTKCYFNTDQALYKSITPKKDTSKIEATEYDVWKNISSVETSIGKVGNKDNTSYPQTNLSKIIRRKAAKLTVNENFSTVEGLDYAYAKLLSELKEVLTIEVKKVDYYRARPKVMDYIIIEDSYNDSFDNIINEDTVFENINEIDGYYQLFYNNTTSKIYQAESNLSFFQAKKIGFFLKTNYAAEDITKNPPIISIGFAKINDNLDTISYTKIGIRQSGVWEYYEIPYTSSFAYVIFKNTDSISNVYMKNLQILCTKKNQYKSNISKISITIDKLGLNCDFSCGRIVDEINDDLFALNKKIEIFERES
jgi:hypothetical protein